MVVGMCDYSVSPVWFTRKPDNDLGILAQAVVIGWHKENVMNRYKRL